MAGLLCIIAHPDDELFCGGLLAAVAERGVPVHLACLTRGEGGESGHLQVPPEDLGEQRAQEMRCSAGIVGANTLTFMRYCDPPPQDGQLSVPRYDPKRLARDIRQLIGQSKPEVVLTHGSDGEYGHPAHRLVHSMVLEEICTLGTAAPALYSFNAFHGEGAAHGQLNESDPAHFILDVTPFYDVKAAMLQCHRTQWHTLLGPHGSEEAYLAAIAEYVHRTRTEGYRRHAASAAGRRDALRAWIGADAEASSLAMYTALYRRRARRYFRRWAKRVLALPR
ncbi:MAG: hypothetical protein GVY12_02115 [Bacteroidetes bacterium]|nr:hypothetical protein [Bacteroidota bacterium]